MTVLTLLAKVRGTGQIKLVEELLKNEFENLEVDFKVSGAPVNRWVQVSISGEDEVIATNYIKKEIGTCPISQEKIEEHSATKGYITKVDYSRNELTVDIGVFQPKTASATITLTTMRTQLADGKKADFKKICVAYGLQENLPIEVKILEASSSDEGHFQAELSSAQIEKIREWQQSLLDRLIVLGATAVEIDEVVRRTRLERDVIDVERLGLFEYSLTCKLGTDAAGLISRMGRYMRNSVFVVFSPRRTAELIGETPLAL